MFVILENNITDFIKKYTYGTIYLKDVSTV